ncbi:uncharacterized protein LOC128550469 [Mercenaria mercenaria]|uniref:uncharacterized protein LOC128550469 n=1 Tax=Mercenaria mercenaria TaxID=6596 RepID=UPI00234E80E7|nr:uncharacterized protein LOC128550469 [Mercenaria mercenaria]
MTTTELQRAYRQKDVQFHHGKLVDMFCKDHDEVCCPACIAINHRACVNVDYLPDVAKGIQKSAELSDTRQALENVLTKMKQEQEIKTSKLTTLHHEKEKLSEEIENFKNELIKKIEELAETSKQQISSKYEDIRKDEQSALDTLGTAISTTKTNLQKLSSKNESQLFVNVKRSKLSINDCETLLREQTTGKKTERLKFVLNREMKENLTSMGFVVTAEDVKEYRAILYGRYKINPTRCEITSICTMDDGTYVIADYTDLQITRLDGNFGVRDHIKVSGNPFSVCRVGPKEVASLPYGINKIQFVSIGRRMELKTEFNVGSSAVGVSYDAAQDSLFVCHSNQVSIYTKSGVLLRTYEKNENGDRLFTSANQLALNVSSHIMFVTDENGKLTALSKDGKVIWTFSDSELRRPWGVCVLPGDIILASGMGSKNVLQIDKDGRKFGELLGASEQLKNPYALAFDRKHSKLLIGSSSNEIHVYTLSRK